MGLENLRVADRTKKAPSEKKTSEIKIIPSLEPRLGRVYSNYVSVSHTKYDFTIRFGDLPPGGDVERLRRGNELPISNIAEIIVAPVLIPAIIEALDVTYKSYLELYKDAVKEDKGTE